MILPVYLTYQLVRTVRFYVWWLLLGRHVAVQSIKCSLLLHLLWRGLSVFVSVQTLVSRTKTAGPIVLPFCVCARVGRKSRVGSGALSK